MVNKMLRGSNVQKSQVGSKENNFNMIRLIATIFVFAGHMGVLLGMQPPLLGSFPLHELGVAVLFLISGYLITMSWISDTNPLRYGIRRFFRLWPPFAVMILIMVFLAGPLVSDLSVQEYFQSDYKVYLRNLRFFIIYAQPGVFSDSPFSNATNGSLWTMPVEALLYILTPILLTGLRVKYRSRKSFYFTTVLAAAAVAFDMYLRVFCAAARVVFYGTDLIAAYHLIVFYIIGILYTYEEVKKRLNIQLGCIAVCTLLLFQRAAFPLQYTVLYILLPYFIFSFVFVSMPAFSGLGRKMELSYGIYLYGFFFQQLIVSLNQKYGMNLSYLQAFALSLLPTLAAADLSYFLIEKPILGLSRCLIRKLRTNNGSSF